MSLDLMLFTSSLIQKQAVSEIMRLNETTGRHGLVLTEQQAIELVNTRSQSLSSTLRIEFGGGVIDKIITVFCDSPHIVPGNYAETLNELIEIFYYYKNETLDIISDHNLMKIMKTFFDGECQGSLELLKSRELNKIARLYKGEWCPEA